MIQDLVGNVVPAFKATESWANNIIGSALACALWGYFLYQGVIDPLGGIWTMWPLFGTANQMLAAIALMLCTVVLFKMKRERVAWVTIVPTTWLVICTVTAGLEKVFSPTPRSASSATHCGSATRRPRGRFSRRPRPAEMNRVIFNDYVDATLAALFAAIVVAVVIYGIIDVRKALRNAKTRASRSVARRWRPNDRDIRRTGQIRLRDGRADRPLDGWQFPTTNLRHASSGQSSGPADHDAQGILP